MTRSQRKEFEKRAKYAVDVAKRIIHTEIGKRKEDHGLDQHAATTGRAVGRRNNKFYRLDGPQFVIWGMIDGYDESTARSSNTSSARTVSSAACPTTSACNASST